MGFSLWIARFPWWLFYLLFPEVPPRWACHTRSPLWAVFDLGFPSSGALQHWAQHLCAWFLVQQRRLSVFGSASSSCSLPLISLHWSPVFCSLLCLSELIEHCCIFKENEYYFSSGGEFGGAHALQHAHLTQGGPHPFILTQVVAVVRVHSLTHHSAFPVWIHRGPKVVLMARALRKNMVDFKTEDNVLPWTATWIRVPYPP